MRLNVDQYLDRKFNLYSYNCWHFVRDVWQDLFGIDITARAPGIQTVRELSKHFTGTDAGFKRLSAPESPCIVLLKRPRTTPHVGIYNEGSVLSIDRRGVTYMPLETVALTFTSIGFYR